MINNKPVGLKHDESGNLEHDLKLFFNLVNFNAKTVDANKDAINARLLHLSVLTRQSTNDKNLAIAANMLELIVYLLEE